MHMLNYIGITLVGYFSTRKKLSYITYASIVTLVMSSAKVSMNQKGIFLTWIPVPRMAPQQIFQMLY